LKLVKVMFKLLGEPKSLLKNAQILARWETKAKEILNQHSLEDAAELLTWVMTKAEDSFWRDAITEADNPMVMFASKIDKIIEKHEAANRKKAKPAASTNSGAGNPWGAPENVFN
jgi:hypothetical protein